MEGDAKSRVGEKEASRGVRHCTEEKCYVWKRNSYCIDFPKLVPSTCVLTYNPLVT